MSTPTLVAKIPPALLDAAREGLGLPTDATRSEVVRRSLATAAGRRVEEFPVPRPGRQPRQPAAAA